MKNHSDHVAAAYLDANRAGQHWLRTYCADHNIPTEQRDAYTYAGTPAGASAVRREFDIARRLGLPVQMTDAVELPFPSYAAVRLPDQLQFNPVDVLASLAEELRRTGGLVIERARVTGVSGRSSCELITSAGRLTADNVVLASGIPFLDRGLYFAKVTRATLVRTGIPGEHPDSAWHVYLGGCADPVVAYGASRG